MSGAELLAEYVQWHQKNRPNIPLPKDRRAAARVAEAIRDALVPGMSKTETATLGKTP